MNNPMQALRMVPGVMLLSVHLVLATVILILVAGRYAARKAEVAETRAAAANDLAEVHAAERRVSVQRARVEGLQKSDPYVVELVARERIDYSIPGEVTPPPASSAVKSDATP